MTTRQTADHEGQIQQLQSASQYLLLDILDWDQELQLISTGVFHRDACKAGLCSDALCPIVYRDRNNLSSSLPSSWYQLLRMVSFPVPTVLEKLLSLSSKLPFCLSLLGQALSLPTNDSWFLKSLTVCLTFSVDQTGKHESQEKSA